MSLAVLLCAKCGSHHVDVIGWRSRTLATLRCSSCSHESLVNGFTVGRVDAVNESDIVTSAIEDAAMPMGVR